jgi:hypothetical protein
MRVLTSCFCPILEHEPNATEDSCPVTTVALLRLATLRLAMRRQLEADAAMLAEVKRLLADAPRPAVTQHVTAGRDAYVAGRDITITRPVD